MSTSLKALVTRKKIVAADVVVDPNTKNRYFTETLNLSELANMSFATTATDGITFSESYNSETGSFQSDSVGISENINTHLTHQRQFSDSFSVSESLIKTPNLGLRHTVVPEESLSFNTGMVETDSFFMDEDLLTQPTPTLFETPTMLDIFDSLRTYFRDFTDSFTLDDFTDIDAITKNTTGIKQNVFGFSDSQEFAVIKPLTETATISESIALANSQLHSENLTLSETFAPVFTFNRTHDETVSVSESTVLQTSLAPSDSTTMGDSNPILAIDGNYQDTATLSESHSLVQSKPLTDSTTISESILTQLTNEASAVFNTTPLNLFTLNS
jgi:hypothetical protein